MLNTTAEFKIKVPADVLKMVDSEKFLIDTRDVEISDQATYLLESFFKTVDLRIKLERAGRNITASSSGIRAARLKKVAAEENDQMVVETLSHLHSEGIRLTAKIDVRSVDYEDELGHGYGPKPVTTIFVNADNSRRSSS